MLERGLARLLGLHALRVAQAVQLFQHIADVHGRRILRLGEERRRGGEEGEDGRDGRKAEGAHAELTDVGAPEASLHHAGLRGVHAAARARLGVVEAVQVQQSVNDAERDFAIDRLPEARRVGLRGFGADDDVAVLESDDIGRARDAHELRVDRGDAAIGDDGDGDFIERLQREAPVAGDARAFLERDRGEAAQRREVEAHAALEIANGDQVLEKTRVSF